MSRFTAPIAAKLEDPDAERVRRAHHDAIRELQTAASAIPSTIADVSLVDGIDTPVAHAVGRRPSFVSSSVQRGGTSTGRITEVRSGSYDRSKVVVLRADGWGATITVDVMVF